jgi:hypothetical protein
MRTEVIRASQLQERIIDYIVSLRDLEASSRSNRLSLENRVLFEHPNPGVHEDVGRPAGAGLPETDRLSRW